VNELELVARARRGDAAAFGQLVDEHRGAVFRAAMAVLGSAPEAEEAAQDAFLAAFRKLDTFRGASTFKTWLLAIVWRHALTYRRQLRSRWRRFVSGEVGGWEHWPAATPSPESQAIDARLRADVRRLVGGLPERLRAPLLLAAHGEHTYEEMAAILGKRVGTVKWRVSEARRLLRERLLRLGYGDE
jgi:RNA polymerase sigma-70 factor (ECF subfamily)